MNHTVSDIYRRKLCTALSALLLLPCPAYPGDRNPTSDVYGMSDEITNAASRYTLNSLTSQHLDYPDIGVRILDLGQNDFTMVYQCAAEGSFLVVWELEDLSSGEPKITFTRGNNPGDISARLNKNARAVLTQNRVRDNGVSYLESLLFISASFLQQLLSQRNGQPVMIRCVVAEDQLVSVTITQSGSVEAPGFVVRQPGSTLVSGDTTLHLEYLGPRPRDESGCLAQYRNATVVLNDIYSLNPAGRFAPGLAAHVVTMDINGGHDEARTLLSIPVDGQQPAIIIAGHSASLARNAMAEKTLDDVVISRLNPNGQVDPCFGSGGMIFNDFAKGIDRILASAAPGDGTFLVAGSGTDAATRDGARTHKDMVILAYTKDGQPLTRFGDSGKTIRDFAGRDDEIRALGVFTDKDGARQIVAAGYVTSNEPGNSSQDSALFIFTANGEQECQKINNFAGGDDQFHALAIIGEGEDTRIIAVGHVTSDQGGNTRRNGYIQAFLPDCSLDNDFVSNGLWVADSESDNERLWAVKVIEYEGERHIITTSVSDRGESAIVPGYRLTLSRFDHQGNLDTHFGDNGHASILVTAPENQPVTLYPVPQQDGPPLILVGKYASPSCEYDNNVLTAFLWNGTQDERFDTPFNQLGGANGAVRAIASLSFANGEQRVIVAGYGFGPGGGAQQDGVAERDFMVAGYHLSGQPDICFGMTTEQLRDTVECQLYLSAPLEGTVPPCPSAPTPTEMVSNNDPGTGASENQGAIAGLSVLAAISIAGNIALGATVLACGIKMRSNAR